MRHLPIDSTLFAKHREQLAERLPVGAIAFANANDVLPTNADGTLPLHPNSDLFYLSGIEQEESILVLFPECIESQAPRNPLFARTQRTLEDLGRSQARQGRGHHDFRHSEHSLGEGIR